MKKIQNCVKITLVALSFILLASCGSNDNKTAEGNKFAYLFDKGGAITPGSIYGTWHIPKRNSGSGQVETRVHFEKSRVLIVNRCFFETGLTLVVGAESPAVIDGSLIQILEAKSDVAKKDNAECSVTVSKGSIPYRIANGNELIWTPNPRATKVAD